MKGTAKMSEVILETRNLTKKYRNQYALKDVSISLKKNHIYGFIGENGAGKSTLMSVLFGLYQPEKGIIKKDNTEAQPYQEGEIGLKGYNCMKGNWEDNDLYGNNTIEINGPKYETFTIE